MQSNGNESCYHAGLEYISNNIEQKVGLFMKIERLTTPKGVPQTWGDAVLLRIGKQNSGYRNTYPFGSNIIGWSGN
mgnify:CR=1 FL=1